MSVAHNKYLFKTFLGWLVWGLYWLWEFVWLSAGFGWDNWCDLALFQESHPPWGQTLSNDQKTLPPLPPASFQQNSKAHSGFRASLEWGLVENEPLFTCLILLPACPNKDSLLNFLHTNLQMRVCSAKLGLWLYCLQRYVKPRCVSQQPIAELLGKWADKHNEEKWQENAGSWEASSSADKRGVDRKTRLPFTARFQGLRETKE